MAIKLNITEGTASTNMFASDFYAGSSTSTGVHHIYTFNNQHSGGLVANGANLGIWDATNDKWIISSAADGYTYIPEARIDGNLTFTGNFECPSSTINCKQIHPSHTSWYYLGDPNYYWHTTYTTNMYCTNIYTNQHQGKMVEADGTHTRFGAASGDGNAETDLRGKVVRLYAHTSGAVYLGSSGTTAVTSDEQLKEIYDIDDKYEIFYDNLKPVAYKYTVPTAGHRPHMGFGARQVEQSLISAGLTSKDFAGLLIDENVHIDEDEWGEEGGKDFDKLYSLRYEEFIALNMMKIKKLEARIQELENAVAAQGE